MEKSSKVEGFKEEEGGGRREGEGWESGLGEGTERRRRRMSRKGWERRRRKRRRREARQGWESPRYLPTYLAYLRAYLTLLGSKLRAYHPRCAARGKGVQLTSGWVCSENKGVQLTMGWVCSGAL
eukprot:1678617-Rhodomonas_salina.1